jgi:DNA-binding NarL/FixJ family response regulator
MGTFRRSFLERITVLVADMPQVQVDLARSLVSRQSDLLLVEASAYEGLERAIVESRADVLLVDVHRENARQLPGRYQQALRDYPRLAVLAVEADAREGSLWELVPHRMRLGEVWPSRLVEAIRQVARRQSHRSDTDPAAPSP